MKLAPVLALLSLALVTAAPAPAEALVETLRVEVWLDGSATAPGMAPTFATRCTVEIPVKGTAADALHAAHEAGCADLAFADFGFGEYVDCVNGICAESYDPSGRWLVARYWAFFVNCEDVTCFPSPVGISDYTLEAGDVVLLSYQLSTWVGGPHNPATAFWVNGERYPFES